MNNYKKYTVVAWAATIFSMSSCLSPMEPSGELKSLPSEEVFDIEVYSLTPGTNAIVLKNNSTQYAPYWNYGTGISTRQNDTVFIPYTGEFVISFTGMCDGGPVSTQRKISIEHIDWPKLESDEVELLLKYDFESSTFAPIIEDGAFLSASDMKNVNFTFNFFAEQEGLDENNIRKGIHDHGQGPDHINALNESEAVNSTNAKNNYLSFTVTPNEGKKLDLKWLSFRIQARTGEKTGNPVDLKYFAALYSSVDGFKIGSRLGEISEVSANKANTTSGWLVNETNISSLTVEKDVPIEFRIYFWRVGNTDPRDERWVEIDDVKLHGFVVDE